MPTHRLPLLLIEDDPAHAALVQYCLESQPAIVYHTTDGEEALDYLLHRGRYADPADTPRPAVIMLDLNLPKINGFDVLRQIKDSSVLHAIPVVILSTSDSVEDMQRAYALGAASYVVKPMEFTAFVEALGRVCEKWLKEAA